MITTDLRKNVDAKLAAFHTARSMYRSERAALRTAEADTAAARTALALAQQVAMSVQEQAHRQIADVVSRSLEAVFDEPYEFRIRFEQKRGRTEASLVFARDGVDVDPLTASGGGVVDVAAFALRLSALLLSRPPVRRLLVMDEPFRFVSVEYRERVGMLLERLADELDFQFIVVTHMEELKTGTIIQL